MVRSEYNRHDLAWPQLFEHGAGGALYWRFAVHGP
jgi:hypothetical protein